MFTSECVRPGDTLTYDCTVTGQPGGFTVWTGSAFDCLSNEISLPHNRYTLAEGAFGVCNNGAIVAKSLSVEANNYTSQFNVTVTTDIAGKTIECVRNDTFITVQLCIVTPTTLTGT